MAKKVDDDLYLEEEVGEKRFDDYYEDESGVEEKGVKKGKTKPEDDEEVSDEYKGGLEEKEEEY